MARLVIQGSGAQTRRKASGVCLVGNLEQAHATATQVSPARVAAVAAVAHRWVARVAAAVAAALEDAQAKAAALAPRVTRAWGSSPSILRSSSRIPRSSLKTVETLASEEMAGKGETVIVAVSARAVSVAARMVDAVEMARAVETVARAAMASLERAGRSGARHPRSCAKENRASLSVREESCVMAHALPPGRCSDVTEPP